MNIGHWLRRFLLNLRGFVAATVAMLLPGAAPFLRKLLAAWLTSVVIIAHHKLGIEYAESPELAGFIGTVVDLVIAGVGNFSVWRVPNEKPTALDKANPIIDAATDVPPK